MTNNEEDFYKAFKLVCRKCGSENCVIDFDPGRVYSECTEDPAVVTLGCNDCKVNDLAIYL
jgi:ribosomal protein L33